MTQHQADVEALTADLRGAQSMAWHLMLEAEGVEKDALFNVGYNVGIALRLLDHAHKQEAEAQPTAASHNHHATVAG